MIGAMTRYDPATIEPKWQAFWEENDTFRTPDASVRRTNALSAWRPRRHNI